MATDKKKLPLQLQKLPAEHLRKVREHVKGLLDAGLQEICDLNSLYEVLEANLQSGGASGTSAPAGGGDFKPGQRVEIQGLTGAKEFNGKTGKILRLDESSGRYVVDVTGSGEQKAFKAANLVASSVPDEPPSPKVQAARAERQRQKEEERKSAQAQNPEPPKAGDFTVGDRVRVGGLNGAIDLNGQIAVIFGLDKASGRYVVEFENGQGQKRLQGKNLTPMGVATGALAAKARMFALMNGG